MTTTTCYVVNKIGWNYNDEYYYTSENNDGRPLKVFKLLSLAEEEKLKLTIKEFRPLCKDRCINLYMNYDDYYKDVLPFDNSCAEFSKFLKMKLSNNTKNKGKHLISEKNTPTPKITIDKFYELSDKFSDKDWEFVVSKLKMSFYEIVKTTIVE